MNRSSFSTSVALNFGLIANMLGQSQPEDLAAGEIRAIRFANLQPFWPFLCYGLYLHWLGLES